MQKVLVLLAGILLTTLGWSQPLAPFSYKLLPTNNPQGLSNVQFVCQLPQSATDLLWDFGQGGSTSTQRDPVFGYNVVSGTTFDVKLDYSLSGQALSYEVKIDVSPAYFRVEPDSNFMDLASLKRVLRSAFLIKENSETAIGDMRFEWTVDGEHPIHAEFPGGSMGDYPNLYYTFPSGGTHNVTLRVHHSSSAANYAEYTRVLVLEPTDPSAKLDFENLPQFITPNGDGINDFFEVSATGTTPLVFMVFSRTGSLLYQQESNVIRWDGANYNGLSLPEGIYFYTLEDKGGMYNPAKGFFYIFRGK